MRRAIATVCLSGMLPEKLQAAAAAGFDGVEIFENDLLQYPGSATEVRRMAADLGLTIDLFQPFRDFDAPTPKMLARNLERAERKFDLMAELGTTMVLVCSNVQPDALGDTALLAEQFAQLAERAGQRGMFVSYEALAWGTQVNRFSQAWEVVRRVNHPHLGLTLDSFHTLAIRDDPAPIAQLPGEKIFFVQLADAPWVNTDVLSHSRHYRCFPGQGELDVTRFTRALVDAGYSGPLSLEVFNDEFRSTSARANAVDAMRSLLWLEDQVRRQPPADAPRVLATPLFAPPAAPPLAGWGFVEFAVDTAAGTRMAGWLQSMGFARIGTHRDKDVQLFGQGEVRIVLNLEADSPARSHFDLHGPSVCALALTTPDTAATLARAEALLSPRVTGQAGAQDLNIPAVRAPDGSLLHVCAPPAHGRHDFERYFDIDEAALRATPAGANARIDHVVQAVPAGQVEPWLLFHRAVLGLSAERQVVLHDPYGVIRSRELESKDRAVRVSITVSERENTSVSRAVSRFRGAGVQQIAVRVDDLVTTARALQAMGAPMLRVPANYYDDLAAKFDIDDARLADLRALGILYDREPGGGEFLQLYLGAFDERFHFELVQRIGGYDGYGAANAPVRLAAMALQRDP
jgi:4-hydroxyphenylpyruvate dioxygenase